jgi:hypothetical protein
MRTRRSDLMAAFALRGGWSTVVFSAALYGVGAASHGYMVKALQNLELIAELYPGARVVLYYDATVAAALVATIRELRLAVVLVWVEHRTGSGIMLARLLELSAKRAGVRWVALLDIHDELHEQRAFRLGVDEAVRRCIVPTDPQHELQVMHFAPSRVCRSSRACRTPHRHVDAAGVGVSTGAAMPPIAPLVEAFLSRHEYRYGDDERVLDEWISSVVPRWHELAAPGVLFLSRDEERDMNLSGARRLAPDAIGPDGRFAAHEVLDWTRFAAQSVPDRPNFAAVKKLGAC